ncbi:MAG: putative peptidoglycan glycosyltransferase FtsW [Verrucomicrobiota bacterium]
MIETPTADALEPQPSTLGQGKWRLDDWLLLLCVGVLLGIGIVVLFSSTYIMDSSDVFSILRRQMLWMLASTLAFLFAMRINLDAVREVIWYAVPVAIVLCLMVFLPVIGREINGTRRWLILGPMRLQVAEVLKVVLIFLMAHYLSAYQRRLGTVTWGFLIPGAIIGISFGLVLLQPDYGTAFLCALVCGILLFLAGGRLKFWVPAGLLGLGGFSLLVWNNPERLSRVTSFLALGDEAVRKDDGYQLWQGILGFASGGNTGVGLGHGRQQLTYLPEAHTDFIFSIVGEEMGFVMTGLILLLFLGIFIIVNFKLKFAPTVYQYLVVQGCLLFMLLQALINMGVVTGVLPTKGMSLPFISYGGSNLILMFFCLGVILNASRSWRGRDVKGGTATA